MGNQNGNARVYLHRNSKTLFTVQNEGRDMYVQGPNGRFHLVPRFDLSKDQFKTLPSIQFTKEGLDEVSKKYDSIPGTAAFLYEIFNFNYSYKQLKDMAEHPELFPMLQITHHMIAKIYDTQVRKN